jgi:hypothetical protein
MPKKEKIIDIQYRRNNIIGIRKIKGSPYTIDKLLEFNLEDYWIVKATRKHKICNSDEFLNMKNCGYILLDKKYWDKNLINKNIEFLNYYSFTPFSTKFLQNYVLDKVEFIQL